MHILKTMSFVLLLTLIATLNPTYTFAHVVDGSEDHPHDETNTTREVVPQKAFENRLRANTTKYEEIRKDFKAKSELRRENVKEALTDVQEARLATIKENAARAQARILKSTEILSNLTDRLETKLAEEDKLTTANQSKIEDIRDDITLVETRAENLSSLYENIESSSSQEITASLLKLKQEIRAIITSLKGIKTDLRLLVQQTK